MPVTPEIVCRAGAGRLGIAPRTAGKHIANIYRKPGTHDRVTTVLVHTGARRLR